MSRTPTGFRDILPREALARERTSACVRDCLSAHGYVPVETPLLEVKDSQLAAQMKGSAFQLFDVDGSLLNLRADLTLPIARLVANRLDSSDFPARLRYEAPVVREEQSLKGQPRQFTQLGAELVGADANQAEIEMLSLLAELLDALKIPAWKIVLGSVRPLYYLLDSFEVYGSTREQLLALIHASNFVALDSFLDEQVELSVEAKQVLKRLPRLAGGKELLELLRELLGAGSNDAQTGLEELRVLVERFSEFFDSGLFTFDFSIMNSFDYYTGVIFKVYSEGIAASLGSGGRYDALLASLGMDGISACGFALSLERIQEVLGEQGESGVVSPKTSLAERPLRIAVPKGSLFAESTSALQAAGFDVSGLSDLGRKLRVHAGDVEYIIVRAQDAPAFVAHGGADCGICGSDSLIEADLDLVELVDLGFGACRFVVAEKRGQREAIEEAKSWRGSVRVASKYPRITQAYYDSLGQQVDIVTLHGNIELGPILGMTDRIVDITATGATLQENDLEIVDELMSCTARFFSSTSAYRLDGRIRKLASVLSSLQERKRA